MRWFEINAPCVESYADISYSHHIIIILFGKLGIDTIDVTWNIHFIALCFHGYYTIYTSHKKYETYILSWESQWFDFNFSSPKPISKGWNLLKFGIFGIFGYAGKDAIIWKYLFVLTHYCWLLCLDGYLWNLFNKVHNIRHAGEELIVRFAGDIGWIRIYL